MENRSPRRAPDSVARASVGALFIVVLAACGSPSAGAPDVPASLVTATSSTGERSASAGGGSPACIRGAKTPPAIVLGAPLDTQLRVPAGARDRRAPLVLVMHYGGGTGLQMEAVTRFTPEATRSGFIVAYPTSTSAGSWSADTDFAKLAKTLDAVEKVACVDPSRVYVTGMSNGGYMAEAMACGMAERIAAVVLFAPAVDGSDSCAPTQPVSVLEVHGTSDPIVAYDIAPALLAGWGTRDGCASLSTSSDTSGAVTVSTWSGCRNGARVEHLRLAGGHHVELFPELRAAGVDPAATAWAFLRAHRLPRG